MSFLIDLWILHMLGDELGEGLGLAIWIAGHVALVLLIYVCIRAFDGGG